MNLAATQSDETVASWLQRIGLPHVAKFFIAHGWDAIDYGVDIEESDLDDMGITSDDKAAVLGAINDRKSFLHPSRFQGGSTRRSGRQQRTASNSEC